MTESEIAKLSEDEEVHAKHLMMCVSNGLRLLLVDWHSFTKKHQLTEVAHRAKELAQVVETLSRR